MPVTRGQIVAAALDLLDEAGLDGLTLRQLAGRHPRPHAVLACPGQARTARPAGGRDPGRGAGRLAGAAAGTAVVGVARGPGPGHARGATGPPRQRADRRRQLAARVQPARHRAATAGTGRRRFTPRDGLLALLALNAYVIGDVIDQQADGTRQRPAPTKPLPSAEPPAVAREPVIPATPVPATEPGAPVGSEGPDGGAGTPPGIGPDGPYPLLSAAIGGVSSPDQRFEHGLGALVAGLRTRHAE